MNIEVASKAIAEESLPRLIEIIINSVDNDGSIGWLPPMDAAAAEDYWQGRIAAIDDGTCVLFLAWVDDVIAGTAQLGLVDKPNGDHRAEVQKLLVHTDYRRQGIGRQLMMAVEDYAINQANRSLLYLDTREGDVSEFLYRDLGYGEVGKIPNYVRNPDGSLVATVVYYKIIGG